MSTGRPPPPRPAPASPSLQARPLEMTRVLLVDDDEVDRERVVRLFGQAGVHALITEAADPITGLAQLRQSSFDVVLLDYHFPRHDGTLLLRELKEEGSPVPVVMLTGHDDSALAVELMKSGAVDYIPKGGLTAQRLATSLRHALRIGASETATRAVQEALRSTEALLHAIQDHTTDCLAVLDADGALLSLSRRGLRQLGRDDIEAIHGSEWAALWSRAQREVARAAVESARTGVEGRFTGTCPAGPGGDETWWSVTVVPIAGPKGRPDRLLAISHVVPKPEAG